MHRFFLLLISLSSALSLWGQMTELAYEASVKGIDEFMSRFNGYESHLMVDPKAEDAARKNLLMLFDAENTSDVELKLAMADTILSRGTKLSYESKMWYAEATCKMFNGADCTPLSCVYDSCFDHTIYSGKAPVT